MAKLNIHLSLDSQTIEFCHQINFTIRKIVDSPIVFSDSSPMIPHITLVMGELISTQTVEKLINEATLLAQDIRLLKLKLTQPY